MTDKERGFRSRKFAAFAITSGLGFAGFIVATRWTAAGANLTALYQLLVGALVAYAGSNVIQSRVEQPKQA